MSDCKLINKRMNSSAEFYDENMNCNVYFDKESKLYYIKKDDNIFYYNPKDKKYCLLHPTYDYTNKRIIYKTEEEETDAQKKINVYQQSLKTIDKATQNIKNQKALDAYNTLKMTVHPIAEESKDNLKDRLLLAFSFNNTLLEQAQKVL